MGLPPDAGPMINLYRNNLILLAQKKGRQKAVHVIKIWQYQEGTTGKKLNPAARIRSGILENKLPETIGQAGRDFFHQRVLSLAPV